MIRMPGPATLRESCAITVVSQAGILPEGGLTHRPKTKHSVLDRISESLFYAHAANPVIVVELFAKLDPPSQRALSLTQFLRPPALSSQTRSILRWRFPRQYSNPYSRPHLLQSLRFLANTGK